MKYYKASVNVNLNWSKFNSLRANLVIQPILRLILYKATESFTQSYRGSLGRFKVWPNLELGYSLSLNDYQNTTFTTKQPFAKVDYLFLKSFSLRPTTIDTIIQTLKVP
jgi:hypothetical protein